MAEKQTLSVLLELRDRLTSALSNPLSKMKTLEASVRTMGRSFKIAGGLAIGAFALMSRQILNASDNLVKLQNVTGVGVEKLQKLGLAAELNSTSMDELAIGLRHLARSANEAAMGTSEATDLFKRLGVQVKDSNGNLKGTEELFNDVANAIGNISNPTEQTALAMEAFGRSGTNLIPLLKSGTKGIDEIGRVAEDLGIVIKQDTVEALEVFGDQLALLKKVGQAFVAEGLKAIADNLPAIIELFIEFLKVVNSASNRIIAYGKDVTFTFQFLKRQADVAAIGFEAVFGDVNKAVRMAFDELKKPNAWDEMASNSEKAFKESEKNTKEQISALDDLKKRVLAGIDVIAKMGSEADKTGQKIQGMAKQVKDSLDEANLSESRFRVEENLTGNTLEANQSLLKSLIETRDKLKTKILEDNDLTRDEANLYETINAKITERTKIVNELTTETDKQTEAIKRAAQKSEEAARKTAEGNPLTGLQMAMEDLKANIPSFRSSFNTLFSSIEGAFANAFEGMISGAKKWKDTLKGFFRDLKGSFVRMLSDMAAQQLMRSLLGITPLGFGGGGMQAPAQQAGQAGAPTPGVPGVVAGFSPASMFAGLGIGAGAAIGSAGLQRGNVAQSSLGFGASGALAGAMIGGPIGALVGGGLGLIGGLVGGRKARQEAKKEEEEAEHEVEEANEALEAQRREAAKVVKEALITQLGGGLATPEAVDAASRILSGDVTPEDLEGADVQQILGRAGEVRQLAANRSLVNVGAPVVNVNVGQISSSYDVQNLLQDIGFGLRSAIEGAAGAE